MTVHGTHVNRGGVEVRRMRKYRFGHGVRRTRVLILCTAKGWKNRGRNAKCLGMKESGGVFLFIVKFGESWVHLYSTKHVYGVEFLELFLSVGLKGYFSSCVLGEDVDMPTCK